ncbi:uncharacterized protein HMPREF1541_04703 [Cyphellophora europaea CBS 101466]|uniref:Uncharacterized protein n=1 Tax=Cyphellophora europaea (strain CBS 101466) TaxID=1220924 RepID=W2RVA3_CYPE1|nr:uncharacterized protein HMPREF1541_04703 [Cyphellophora europaea CBS 101466]ETN40426.1 hypothetical protein HMPREF1541_04703 [Cyphellophora europaea CBS 101466]
MPRYEDDYGRREDPRAATVRREVREDRHAPARVETRERTRVIEDPRDPRGASRTQEPMEIVDSRLMSASRTMGDPRGANAAARLEPRPDRHGGGVVSRARDEPTYYDDHKPTRMVDPRDARTADVYSRETAPRYSNPRDDRMDTEPDIPPPRRSAAREVVDPREHYMDEDHRSNRYNDYFVPGAGIEVIQHEICRYLGNDATVRPFTNKDGRTGFLVRAYRALTSAMIDDLKRDSARWRQDQDRRNRQGRSTVSYAEMKGRQEADYGDSMDVDTQDYAHEAVPRHREIDPRDIHARDVRDPRDLRDPRNVQGRHGVTPVSSGAYGQEPYPAYSIGSSQPGNYGPEGIPRYGGGGNTPPTTRAPVPGYGQPGYGGRNAAPAAPPAQAYRDPRTGQMVTGYETGYADPRSRHGR